MGETLPEGESSTTWNSALLDLYEHLRTEGRHSLEWVSAQLGPGGPSLACPVAQLRRLMMLQRLGTTLTTRSWIPEQSQWRPKLYAEPPPYLQAGITYYGRLQPTGFLHVAAPSPPSLPVLLAEIFKPPSRADDISQ